MRKIVNPMVTLGMGLVLVAAVGCGNGSDSDGKQSDEESSEECLGGEFSLSPEPTEGDCSSEIIGYIKENVPNVTMGAGPCGETYSPAPQLWKTEKHGESYLKINSHSIVSGPRTQDGFEPGTMTVEVERYDTDNFPSSGDEPVGECEHDFAIEFIRLSAGRPYDND